MGSVQTQRLEDVFDTRLLGRTAGHLLDDLANLVVAVVVVVPVRTRLALNREVVVEAGGQSEEMADFCTEAMSNVESAISSSHE